MPSCYLRERYVILYRTYDVYLVVHTRTIRIISEICTGTADVRHIAAVAQPIQFRWRNKYQDNKWYDNVRCMAVRLVLIGEFFVHNFQSLEVTGDRYVSRYEGVLSQLVKFSSRKKKRKLKFLYFLDKISEKSERKKMRGK